MFITGYDIYTKLLLSDLKYLIVSEVLS